MSDASARPCRQDIAAQTTRSRCCEEMLLIRRFEEKCAELYQAGKIRGFLHLYIGEEAVAVGAMQALDGRGRRRRRRIASTATRWRAACRADALMAEMYGKANGCSRGRGGSMHFFDAQRRFYGGYAIVGGGLPIAARPGARRTRCAASRASRPASSAMAPSPRASSTSR